MPVPLLAFALGGAALGALANPEDRKKGALMGLGAGLLAPLAAPALAGGGAAAGGAAAPVMTATTPLGAGAVGQGTAALAGQTAATGAATGASMAAPVGIQSVLPGAAIGPGGIAHTGTMGSKLAAGAQGLASKAGEFIAAETPGIAKDVATASLISQATQPKTPPPGPAQSMALRGQQSPSESLYDRAAVNRQARMKKRQQGPKRFI